MTLDEVATMLANFAKLTAENSKDWENYKEICKTTLKDAYNAGKKVGNKNEC